MHSTDLRFTSQGAAREFAAEAAGIDIASLSLLQRVLLISDGTVTDVVATAFLEPIHLVKISEEASPAQLPIDALDLKSGELVMRREILLQGERSRINRVYAESLIALDRLNPNLRDQLMNSDIPIGRLWMQHKLETRKEILKIWHVADGELCSYFGSAAKSGLLARTYRVFSGGRPIMLISEYFPLAGTASATATPIASSPS